MQLLGHKDIRMTLRYVQVTQQDSQWEFRLARQNAVQLHHIPNSPFPKLPFRFAPTLPPFATSSPPPVTSYSCFAFSSKMTTPVVNFDALPNGFSTSAANSITSRQNERTLAGQWTPNGHARLDTKNSLIFEALNVLEQLGLSNTFLRIVGQEGGRGQQFEDLRFDYCCPYSCTQAVEILGHVTFSLGTVPRVCA
jgi:hypothetical protein